MKYDIEKITNRIKIKKIIIKVIKKIVILILILLFIINAILLYNSFKGKDEIQNIFGIYFFWPHNV